MIRSTVSIVNIEGSAFHRMDVPALLINAADDSLTPLVGSQLLRAALPQALLEVPEFGGHDCLVANDAPFERMVLGKGLGSARITANSMFFWQGLFGYSR